MCPCMARCALAYASRLLQHASSSSGEDLLAALSLNVVRHSASLAFLGVRLSAVRPGAFRRRVPLSCIISALG